MVPGLDPVGTVVAMWFCDECGAPAVGGDPAAADPPLCPEHGPRWRLVRNAPCAEVLVERDGIEAKGGAWTADEEEAFKSPIRDQYERQGHPYYATARLWDDGVIDPADTRRVLALGLAAALNAPIEETRYGVFRM